MKRCMYMYFYNVIAFCHLSGTLRKRGTHTHLPIARQRSYNEAENMLKIVERNH